MKCYLFCSSLGSRPTLQEIKAIKIVKSCGVEPLGIQHGVGLVPDLFLFRDEHGSTVAVPLGSICESAVRAKLSESKRRWEPSSLHEGICN